MGKARVDIAKRVENVIVVVCLLHLVCHFAEQRRVKGERSDRNMAPWAKDAPRIAMEKV